MDNGRHFGYSTPKKQPSLYGHRRLSFKLLENTSKGREFSRLISTLANKSNTKFSPSNDDKSNHGKNDKGDFEPFENKIYLKNQLSENPQQEKSTENIFSVDKTEGRVNGTGCHNIQETTNSTFVPDLQDNAGLKDINKEATITKKQAGAEKKVANSIKETVNCHTSIDPEKPPPLISPAFTNYDTTNKILKKIGERAFSDSKKTALFERKYGENNLPNWPDIAIWKVRENDLMWMPECLSDDEYIIEGTTENNELEKRKEKACVGPPSEESDLTGVNNRASRLFKLKNNLYKHYAGLKKLNRRRSTGILEKGITLNLRVKGKETLNTRGRSIHLYDFNSGSNTPTRSTRLNTVVSGRRLGLDTKNRKLHRTKGQKLFYYGHDQGNCTMNVNKLPATLVIESPTTSKLQKRSSHTYGARSNSNSNSTRHISMVHGKDIASETVVGMDMSVNSEFDINTGSGCSVWHSQAISTEANEPDDDKLAIPASYKQTEKSTNASSNKEDRYESDDWNQDECKNEKPHLRASETSESRLTIEEMKRMLFMGDVSNDIAECSYELLRKMQDTVFCKTIYQNTNDSTGLFNAIRSALAKQSTYNYQSKKYASTTIHFLYVVFLTLSFKHNPEFTYSLLLDHRVFEQIVEMFHLSTSSEGQEMSRLSRQVMVNNGIVFSIEASSTISLDFLSLYFINSVIQDQAPAAVALSSMIKSELYKSGTISAVFELMLTKWVSEWLDHVSSLQCFWDPHQHSFYRINDNLLIILQMSFRVLQYGIHFNCLDVNSTSVEAQSAILLNLLDTTEYLIMHSIEKHSDHFFGKDVGHISGTSFHLLPQLADLISYVLDLLLFTTFSSSSSVDTIIYSTGFESICKSLFLPFSPNLISFFSCLETSSQQPNITTPINTHKKTAITEYLSCKLREIVLLSTKLLCNCINVSNATRDCIFSININGIPCVDALKKVLLGICSVELSGNSSMYTIDSPISLDKGAIVGSSGFPDKFQLFNSSFNPSCISRISITELSDLLTLLLCCIYNCSSLGYDKLYGIIPKRYMDIFLQKLKNNPFHQC